MFAIKIHKSVWPLLLLCSLAVKAQEVNELVPPFDFPIVFSGNFGEIRANHFHGGLDFKTGGGIGKQVRALADGYISRIRVTHGSGYVLDITYHNGYHTINRHLSAFIGAIAERVEALQYEQESWEVEIVPEPDEYPVKAGEVIALSGNTGYSFGPHLHLDMLEVSSGDYIDPLPFFRSRVNDHTPPRAEGLMFFPQPGKGWVDGKTTAVTSPAHPQRPIPAWGVIGIGVRAHDFMDGVGNRYGVHTVVLEVDGTEVFRSVVDRFSEEENRYINSWTQGEFMKSFIEPGNRLRMLHAYNGQRGLLTIDEERLYHCVYTLHDALGNTTRLQFDLQGRKTEIPPLPDPDKYSFRWDKVNYLQEPGLELIVPKGRLYDDVRLEYAVRADSGDIAFTYQLSKTRIPLHEPCELRIGLRHMPLADSTKYYIAEVTSRGGKLYQGGTYEAGFMKGRIRQLGTFTVAVDTVAPTLAPVHPNQWGRTGRIVLKARDKESGIVRYRGTIDGQYALFGKTNSISGDLVCVLDSQHVEKGKKHLVEVTVEDACGNRTTERYALFW